MVGSSRNVLKEGFASAASNTCGGEEEEEEVEEEGWGGFEVLEKVRSGRDTRTVMCNRMLHARARPDAQMTRQSIHPAVAADHLGFSWNLFFHSSPNAPLSPRAPFFFPPRVIELCVGCS